MARKNNNNKAWKIFIILSNIISFLSFGLAVYNTYVIYNIDNKKNETSDNGTIIKDITSEIKWTNSGAGRYMNLELDPSAIESGAVYYLDYLFNCDINGNGENTRYISGTILGGEKGLTIIGQQYFSNFIKYTPNSAVNKQYTINILFSYNISPSLINIFIIPYLDDGFVLPHDYSNNDGCALQDGTKIFLRKETIKS